MFRLNLTGERIFIQDVKSAQIPMILEWYNRGKEYSYATGMDRTLNIGELWGKYKEFLGSSEIFFACIYRKSGNEPIGVIRGIVRKEKEKSIWIHSIIILNEYQKKGYGRESINKIFEYFKNDSDKIKVFLSVASSNVKGIGFWGNVGFSKSSKPSHRVAFSDKEIEVVIMEREI